jgi:OOP family OmpA-OmpF porin
LPDIFAAAAGLDPWSFEVAGDRLVVFGRGPADGTVGEAIEAFSGLPGLTVDTGDLEVSETAVAEALTDLLAGGANFATGSATLSEEATALLDEAAALLIDNPSTSLIVEGHTDDQGGEEANLALSQARAQAVADYLVAAGVSADRLTAVGFGETRPVADNATPEGRAQNRRIDFVVEGGAG